MFLKDKKSNRMIVFYKKKGTALLLAVALLMMMLPWRTEHTYRAYAATGRKSSTQTIKVSMESGQIFSKIFDYDMKEAGILLADVEAKGVGCKLRLTIFGSNAEYSLGHTDLPQKELKTDSTGNVKGSLRAGHIMYCGTYHLLVQSEGLVKSSGTLTIRFSSKSSHIENGKGAWNDSRALATDYNINSKKSHQFLLSGYREQKDLEDYYRFHVDKPTYLAMRIKSVTNSGNVPYAFYVYSLTENKRVLVLNRPGKKLTAKLFKAKPGDYSVEVLVNDPEAMTNHQIVYSMYLAKAKKLRSVTLNHKDVKLYLAKNYNRFSLVAKADGKSAGKGTLTFRSSNPSVVKVDKKGKIMAKDQGEAVVTCYAVDQPSVKATCRVFVGKPSLKISSRSKTFYVGKTTKLSVTKTPSKQRITWKTTNSAIATVSSTGVVKGKRPGKAKIYAVSDAGVKSAKCVLTVKKKPVPKKPKKPKKPDPSPNPNPNPGENTDRIAPVLSLSSAHLSPRGTITVTANVAGGKFSAGGAITIKNKFGKSCVIRATVKRGSGTIHYQVNGKTASKRILIY